MLAQLHLRVEVDQPQRLLPENAEEAFDLVQPRGTGRRVVEVDARMPSKPRRDGRRAVRRRSQRPGCVTRVTRADPSIADAGE